MRKTLILTVCLLILILAACNFDDNGADQPPTVVPPTITILPAIITETPRVTATLTPSDTPTASDTPLPSLTPTPITPTVTPTLTPTNPFLGVIISSQSVNVREGPSFSERVVVSVETGREVEVHYYSDDEQWVFVRLIDEDGRLQEGWVNIPLIDIGDQPIPTQGPTSTPTLENDGTLAPFVTATPDGTTTPGTPQVGITPGPNLSNVNILAYCRQRNVTPPRVTTNQTVSVEWSWFVARPELMEDHLEHANYEVLLDGRLLQDYDQYQTAIRRESDNNWYVYWYIPVGRLSEGRHEITFRLTWDEAVNDGYEEFGPGTENVTDEGNCVFTVQ